MSIESTIQHEMFNIFNAVKLIVDGDDIVIDNEYKKIIDNYMNIASFLMTYKMFFLNEELIEKKERFKIKKIIYNKRLNMDDDLDIVTIEYIFSKFLTILFKIFDSKKMKIIKKGKNLIIDLMTDLSRYSIDQELIKVIKNSRNDFNQLQFTTMIFLLNKCGHSVSTKKTKLIIDNI